MFIELPKTRHFHARFLQLASDLRLTRPIDNINSPTMRFNSSLVAVAITVSSLAIASTHTARAAESAVVYPSKGVTKPSGADTHVNVAHLAQLRREILAEIRQEIRREMRRGIQSMGQPDGDRLREIERQDVENERRSTQRLAALQEMELNLETRRVELEREAERAREERRLIATERAADKQAGSSRSRTTIRTGSSPGDAICLDLPDRKQPFGSIGKNDWREWLPNVRFATGSKDLSISRERSGRIALRQRYTPNRQGSPRVVTGARLTKAKTYRMVQSLRFDRGWDWGGERYQGGKIGFGLSGGTSASGGQVDPAGFSLRLMWRGNQDGTGRLVAYSYAADRPDRFGEDIEIGDFEAPIEEWFDVAMEVTTNSSTRASDGKLRIWVNGKLMVDRDGIGWQTAGGKPMIDNLYYSSFYGGGSSDWSPDQTTFARVSDVCWAPVIKGRSGIDPDKGRIRAPAADG